MSSNQSSDEEDNYIYKQQIKKEVEDIKFHYKILDCYKEMNDYIKEKYLPIGQKINSSNLLDFIINEMEKN